MKYFKYLNIVLLLFSCCFIVNANEQTGDDINKEENVVTICSEENQKGCQTFLKEGFYLTDEIHHPIKSFRLVSNPVILSDKTDAPLNNNSDVSTNNSNTSSNTLSNTSPNTSSISSNTSPNTSSNTLSNTSYNTPCISTQHEILFSNSANMHNKDNNIKYPPLEDVMIQMLPNKNINVTSNNFLVSGNKLIYIINSMDASHSKCIWVYKVDPDNSFDIASTERYDETTGKYYVSKISKMPEIQQKDKLTDITIYYSPDFQGLPDLNQYTNLKNVRILCNVLTNKSKTFIIENVYKKIIDYIDHVHPLQIVELEKTQDDNSSGYYETRKTKFFGFNLTTETWPDPPGSITEMHLFNCSKLSHIDFSKYSNLQKLYMYGDTLKSANDEQWNSMVRKILSLALDTVIQVKEAQIKVFGIALSSKTREQRRQAPLTHVQLPRTFTGEIPKVGEPKNSRIQYFSALGAKSVAQDAFINSTTLKELNLPKVKIINQGAFHGNSALTIVNIPEVENIVALAFQYAHSLTKVGDVANIHGDNGIFIPYVKTIGGGAFMADANAQNSIIKYIILPECTSIADNAFVRYRTVKTISIPKCKFIGEVAFYDCYALEELEATAVEEICARSFQYASKPIRSFKTVNGNKVFDKWLELPNCIIIREQAFWGDGSHNIKGTDIVKLPKAKQVADNAFKAADFQSIEAPNVSNSNTILSVSKTK